MLYLSIIGFGAIVVAILGVRRGWPVAGLSILLLSLIVIPRSLSPDPDPSHVGIAQSVPAMATYTICVLALAYLLALRALRVRTARTVPAPVFLFVGFLFVGLVAIWGGTDEQLSGALQLILGFCAWFVGSQVGPLILRDSSRVRWIAWLVLCLVALELVVTVLQRAGFEINAMKPELAALMGNRTNGTTNHPDNLGKVMLLLMIFSLGLIGTEDRRTRRILWLAIVLSVIPLGLSEGRANIVAALATLILWALLSGRRRPLLVRLGIPLLVILMAVPFASSIQQRLQEDPSGGGRAGLASAAVEQIGREPWGTGPNSYVGVVSNYDSATARGYPVHNTFLLTVSELGYVGAVLFWVPVLWLVILAWSSRRRAGFAGSFGLAIVASAPGLYIVNATGWGMISFFPLPLWFLLYGFAYSQFGSPVRRASSASGYAGGQRRAATRAPQRDSFPGDAQPANV